MTSGNSVVHHPFGVDPCDQQNHPIFNATTQKRNAVDPRTGLFEAYVPLPSIVGNNGEGPVVDMSLFYSPLVNNHAGLGDGWSFAFTCYREEQQQLTLHSGEVLKVQKGQNVEQHGVKVDWSNDNASIIVVRPDGHQEKLEQVGESKVWMPTSIACFNNYLDLKWAQQTLAPSVREKYEKLLHDATESSALSGSYIRLVQLKDLERVLGKLIYGDDTVTLVLWPDEEGEQQSFTLTLSDYALKQVEAPDGRACVMKYHDHVKCGRLLNELTSFEGVVELVSYEDNGLIFKDNAKLSALPCVSRHTLIPRGGSSEPVVTTYTYQRDGEIDSQCSTTVSMASGDYTVVYVYDEQHALIKETTSERGCESEKEYEGVTSSSGTILNRNMLVRHASAGRADELDSRKRKGYSVIGSDGKLAFVSTAGGSRKYVPSKKLEDVKSIFPPESGVMFCDGSQAFEFALHGFHGTQRSTESVDVRSEISYASSEAENGAAWCKISINRSRDSKPVHSLLMMSFAGGKSAKLLESSFYSKISCNNTTETLESILHAYQDSRGDWKCISRKTFSVKVDGLERSLTTTSGEVTTTEKTSILSGRLIEQTDAHGNRTTYDYDAHGRLTTLTTCAQSATFRQVTTYSYPSVGRLEITEPDGRQRATEDDGLGNLVAEYAREDDKKPWRQTQKIEYDNRGRKCKTTRYDYLADGTQVAEWCELKYDAWNQECQQIYSTGQQVFNQYDPVAHIRTEWTGKATDKQRKVTTYNADDTVASIVWTDTSGMQCQKETLTYTHAGQVRTRTVEGQHSWRCTTYAYDDAGRLLEQAHDERISADAEEKTTYVYNYEYPENWLMTEPTRIRLDGQVLGEREFDGLGRVTRLNRGDVRETYQYHGANSVPMTRTGADGVTLAFEYFPELGNEVKSVTGRSAQDKALGKQTFTYAHGGIRQSSASEGGQSITFDHDLNERVKRQRARLNESSETTVSRSVSEGGRLLTETDAAGNESVFSYNGRGQRSQVVSGGTKTQHTYDERGRLEQDTVTLGGDKVTVKYAYDTSGQELRRQFTLAGAFDLSIEREYDGEGRLKFIELFDEQAEEALGSHAYTYTVGGALESCCSAGVWQPKNPKGAAIGRQAFTYDSLGNVTTCVSTFGDQRCTSTYTYDRAKGYRLQKVEHSHADYKRAVTIEYDAAGRVTRDHTGKTYAYDWLGRLIQAGSRHYTYDPLNRLASTGNQAGSVPHQLIHDGYRVRGEYPVGASGDRRIVLPGSSACHVQKNKAGTSERTLFNLCDDDGSVLISFDVVSRRPLHHAYSAYGEHSSQEQEALYGYNGEYREAEGDQYPLGRGYRWYAPQIMQFQAQDGASPFDRGGPNAYGYCDGDPVNHTDPSGEWKVRREHWDISACEPAPMGFGKHAALVSAVIFGAITVISAVMTGGSSLLITAALVGLAVVSAATAIAGAIVAESDPEAARILGWVSFAAGVAGGAAQLGKKVVQLTVQLARSGRQVARQLLQKGSAAMRSLREGAGRLPKSVAKPAPGVLRNTAKNALGELRIGEIDRFRPNMRTDYTGAFKSIVKEDSPLTLAFKALDLGDAATVTYAVTGALGLSEADGVMHTTDSWVSNATSLPWGGREKLFSKVRIR
ncbi:RHS repeat-associated core domain-containing protein [Pseudomonas carassii]|uniref:RHS repeat-associated core domain-containing protein n=1 Tax=Pseudomonas carassii TaxID=3115855 RepID=A0ABU7HFT9_9PSED|nr:RHS repeat-associated core domain-containing protein [Pseudomonas sp. 137P]MEE1890182.1 RHS repeat-associated core domain-containing protein [Pseudomonas sp. 137P]